MTGHIQPATRDLPASEVKVMALIGAGHFLSHLYILVLPPLFPLLREVYGVSYTALGFALMVMNLTTMLTQAPLGFLVDRYGARFILVAGLLLFALSIGLIGVFPTYPALLVLVAFAGLGNSVFHPADYAILSGSVKPERMGRAFSIHTFGGYFGFAAAPVVIVFLTELIGWRAALVTVGAAGVAVAAVMLAHSDALRDDGRDVGKEAASGGTGADVRLLLSPPVLMALLFFVMLALAHGGATGFTVAALGDLYAVGLVQANTPLTAYLFASAAGVLAGGIVADRIRHHERAVAICLLAIAGFFALVALLQPALGLVAFLLGVAGFFSGAIAPSRDMMVRAITPAGGSGKVFGFVTTGFSIGGIICPPIFGAILDHGAPALVFWLVALLSLATVLTLTAGRGRSRQGWRKRPEESCAAHRSVGELRKDRIDRS